MEIPLLPWAAVPGLDSFLSLPAVVGSRRTCILPEKACSGTGLQVAVPAVHAFAVGVMPYGQVSLQCTKGFLTGRELFVLQTAVTSAVGSVGDASTLQEQGSILLIPQKKGSVPFQLTVAPAHLVLIAISRAGRLFPRLHRPSL